MKANRANLLSNFKTPTEDIIEIPAPENNNLGGNSTLERLDRPKNWRKRNNDTSYLLKLPKELKELISNTAYTQNLYINEYIINAVKAQLIKDGAKI